MTREQFAELAKRPTLARIQRKSNGRILIVTGYTSNAYLERGSETRFVCGWGHVEKNGQPFGRAFALVPDDFDLVQ
jgi:hypothetical protein